MANKSPTHRVEANLLLQQVDLVAQIGHFRFFRLELLLASRNPLVVLILQCIQSASYFLKKINI